MFILYVIVNAVKPEWIDEATALVTSNYSTYQAKQLCKKAALDQLWSSATALISSLNVSWPTTWMDTGTNTVNNYLTVVGEMDGQNQRWDVIKSGLYCLYSLGPINTGAVTATVSSGRR